jgi:hypothetical protein
VNTAFLGIGAVLANLIGTTGASVLLIRPLLRINRGRARIAHLPIFFIFVVSNLGGLLTAARGSAAVPRLPERRAVLLDAGALEGWLLANSLVLGIFLVWDWLAARGETLRRRRAARRSRCKASSTSPCSRGSWAASCCSARCLAAWARCWARRSCSSCPALAQADTQGAARSERLHLGADPRGRDPLHRHLRVHGARARDAVAPRRELRHHAALAVLLLTGGLSGFLDNAPTYLAFSTLAAGSSDFGVLVRDQAPGLNGPLILQAISCGAVFLGAMTYIGNGPNFMVKAIADGAGYKMPSFFGYLGYSCLVLLPVFVIVTFVFFPPM